MDGPSMIHYYIQDVTLRWPLAENLQDGMDTLKRGVVKSSSGDAVSTPTRTDVDSIISHHPSSARVTELKKKKPLVFARLSVFPSLYPSYPNCLFR